jgi:hypothetical protein
VKRALTCTPAAASSLAAATADLLLLLLLLLSATSPSEVQSAWFDSSTSCSFPASTHMQHMVALGGNLRRTVLTDTRSSSRIMHYGATVVYTCVARAGKHCFWLLVGALTAVVLLAMLCIQGQ